MAGWARAALMFSTRAPASIQSRMAWASSSGVALGISSLAAFVSAKIGRVNRVQLGQIAGAIDPRLADRIPATKVPCRQAILLGWVHALFILPVISRIFSLARSG